VHLFGVEAALWGDQGLQVWLTFTLQLCPVSFEHLNHFLMRLQAPPWRTCLTTTTTGAALAQLPDNHDYAGHSLTAYIIHSSQVESGYAKYKPGRALEEGPWCNKHSGLFQAAQRYIDAGGFAPRQCLVGPQIPW
jgi:hypothetical protein